MTATAVRAETVQRAFLLALSDAEGALAAAAAALQAARETECLLASLTAPTTVGPQC